MSGAIFEPCRKGIRLVETEGDKMHGVPEIFCRRRSFRAKWLHRTRGEFNREAPELSAGFVL